MMLCNRCNQRPATVHYKEVVNNQQKEIYLCEECAKEMNIGIMQPFGDFLPSLFQHTFRQEMPEVRCPHCGMTLNEFSNNGKIGCHDCYDAFFDNLMPVVKRIHGNSRHVGKIPNRGGGELRIKSEIEKLKIELNTAIKEQEFEHAAELRDKIKDLENGKES